ncbi:hypothetical protein HPB50_022338 [Hyalomma asiaticum]|uniref:Uncharacterized protein n=1 Tax=Hyalomma asiaticum TaxID=266040 RepID=A0ACB7RYA7_HYAAI|nr:hypothetical protein HPB50_022338 [Hyalomma asiaticum]
MSVSKFRFPLKERNPKLPRYNLPRFVRDEYGHLVMDALRTEDLPLGPPDDGKFARKRLLVAASGVVALSGVVAVLLCIIVTRPSAFFGRIYVGSNTTRTSSNTSFGNANASSYPANSHTPDALYANEDMFVVEDIDSASLLDGFEALEAPANVLHAIQSRRLLREGMPSSEDVRARPGPAKAQSKPGDIPENTAFSPLAVASALSMVLAGTSGRTARQLCAALSVPDVLTVHEHFRHVFSELGRLDGEIALSLANRLYADDRLRPLCGYQKALDRCYKSAVESERFHAEPEQCRSSINACVERTTCFRVKEILPQGSLDCDTLLVLVSSLYFKGRWCTPFDPGRTVPGGFHESRTRVVRTRMMWGDAPARLNHYCDGLAGRALDVAYKDCGGRFSMTLLVPDQLDGLGALVESLTPERLNRILRGFDPQQDVQLELPRFKVEDTTDLKVVLQAMGVKDLFDPLAAEFSGFTLNEEALKESGSAAQTKGLALSVALHKATIDVNEEGTEMTAPVDVPETPGSFLKDPSRFRVDRPFYFLIRCHNPEVILFAGTVRHVEPL